MAMIGKVKRMYFREKKSVREIVRLTSLSRNTVRKWLKAAVLEEPRYRRSEAPGKLTPFHESIRQALKVDAHRPRHAWSVVKSRTKLIHSRPSESRLPPLAQYSVGTVAQIWIGADRRTTCDLLKPSFCDELDCVGAISASVSRMLSRIFASA